MRLGSRTIRSRFALITAGLLSSVTSWCSIGIAEEQSPFQLRFKRFEIPFAVDSIGSRPTEVELFVSRDAGQQWSKAMSKPPTGQTFLFDADSEGDYWFATRTVDGTGRSFPEGPITPQLHVRIDTTDPELDVRMEFAEDAMVQLNVRCEDKAPDKSKLRIEYMTDTNSTWVPVPDAVNKLEDVSQESLEGQVRFEPAGDWHLLSVRVIAKDVAGNQTIATHQLQRPRLANAPGHLASSPLGRPSAANSPATQGYPPNPYAVRAMQVLNPMPGNLSNQSPLFSAIATEQLSTPPADAPENNVEFNQPLLVAPDQTPAPSQAPPRRPASAAEAMRPLSPADLTKPAPAIDGGTSQSSARPSIESSASSLPPTPSANMPALDIASTSTPVRYSGSRKFSLDYEVESAGRAGVEEVELWGSTDQGATWKRWGADPDRQTPFDIETNNDGVYGFCIVVVAKNGLMTARPIAQSPPDIFVVVDTMRPVVRITGATYGEADQTGSLLIRYQCEDEHISSRPITLSFSGSMQGPWTTIAAGLENRGGYAWPADPQLPRQLFLRIDATDQAGNSGNYVLDTPIDVQGLAPRARIRGFNPITGSGGPSNSTPQTATVPAGELPSVKFK